MNHIINALMLLINLIFQPFLHIFNFEGRSNRLQFIFFFWLGWLVYPLILLLIGSLILVEQDVIEPFGSAISVPLILAWIIAGWSVCIRRLHDVSQSGFLSLVSLIPFLNFGLVIYLTFKKGDEGPNSYGPAPSGPYPTRITKPHGSNEEG